MKKFNVLFIALVLMMSMLFIGCDMFGGEETVTYTLSADDGFELVSATIAFSTSSSVAELDGDNDFTEEEFDNYSQRIYAATDLATLEDGNDPVISFTFSESLRSNELEAVFSFLDSGYGLTYEANTPYCNTFFNISTGYPLDAVGDDEVNCLKNVSVSDSTVSFTFEEGTFEIDNEYLAAFGVVSSAGEAYTVVSSFKAQADIVETITIADDFSDFWAYAIDSDKVYVLDKAIDDCEVDEPRENIENVTISTQGTEFGSYISTLLARATEDGNAFTDSTNTYNSLYGMETSGAFIEYIPLTYTPAEYATDYNFYRCDAEGNIASIPERTTTAAFDHIRSDETTTEVNEDGDVTSTTIHYYFDDEAIKSGDYVMVVPQNDRSDYNNFRYEDYAATYNLVDSVQPFAYTTTQTTALVDVTMATPVEGSGPDFSSHDERDDASWGHLYLVDSFLVKDPDGDTTLWNTIEGVEIVLDSVSLNVAIRNGDTMPTDGNFKSFSSSEGIAAIEEALTEAAGTPTTLDTTVNTVLSSSGGNVWVVYNNTTNSVDVYVGFICSDGDSGIDYSGVDFQVWGSFDFDVADLSGNDLMYAEADDATEIHTNGEMTFTFNSLDA